MKPTTLVRLCLLAVASHTSGLAAQVAPTVNAPGQNLLAPPPNTMITLLVPVALQDLHPSITRVAVECKLVSYDKNDQSYNWDGFGWSDTLAVPYGGNLTQDVVVYIQPNIAASLDGIPTMTSECQLYIGTAQGDLVQPSLNEVRSGFAFRARSDRLFVVEVKDTIP